MDISLTPEEKSLLGRLVPAVQDNALRRELERVLAEAPTHYDASPVEAAAAAEAPGDESQLTDAERDLLAGLAARVNGIPRSSGDAGHVAGSSDDLEVLDRFLSSLGLSPPEGR